MKKNIIVTGGAGFIGSNLCRKLVGQGHKVAAIDNLSSGRREFIEDMMSNDNFSLYIMDLMKQDIDDLLEGIEEIWHFAANPDIRIGNEDTQTHFNQNIVVTYRLLEAMKNCKNCKLIFASTSTVYGEATTPTKESFGPLKPISLYGASKAACEGLISAYSHLFGFRSWIFRLANVIGIPCSHGVIRDFIDKLEANPDELEILGNGRQSKSYIHVSDCIGAMILASHKASSKVNVFNVGTEDQVSVREIAKTVSNAMNLNPRFKYTGNDRGWKGDVPKMLLSIEKLKSTGWEPRLKSREAVQRTIDMLKLND